MTIGIGWPNGEVVNEHLYTLDGPLLVLSPEHWHVEDIIAHSIDFVYRIVPPPGQRPAELNWNPSLYIQMVIEQVHNLPITDLIPWNELDLNEERGDHQDDLDQSQWAQRYALIGTWGLEVIQRLKQRYPGVRIHWPAFTPNADHGAVDHINQWILAARNCHVVNFHGYDTLEKIQHEYSLYKPQFPNHPLELTEWHGKGNLEEEQRIIKWLREEKLKNYFFIYRWDNAPGWWSTDYDIEHNPERYNLIRSANTTEIPMPTVDELKAFAQQQCMVKGVYWPTYEKQIQQESGWRHYNGDGTVLTSPGGAKGIGQIVPSSHPTANWQDPYGNLSYSIGLMASHLQKFGTYRKALSAYNWGPGNVGGYKDSQGRTHPAWDGTREWRCPIAAQACRTGQRDQYLDVILGPEWKEPNITGEPEPMPEPTYSFQFGFKTLADQLGTDVVGKPISPETYTTPDTSVQYTTTGKMEYSKVGNKSYFFVAVQ